MNLAHKEAAQTRASILELTGGPPDKMLAEVRKIVMPRHHDVRATDVNMKRLGAALTLAHERGTSDFESLLLLEGVGPRTIQSLTLVSEVIYGSPTRFNDPARFSFAHGGKDGHPFPVPLKVYDETISVLRSAVDRSKIGVTDKQHAIRQLSTMAWKIEETFTPNAFFDDVVRKERADAPLHGGMTVGQKRRPPSQLDLFS